jgi:hypothetical protein
MVIQRTIKNAGVIFILISLSACTINVTHDSSTPPPTPAQEEAVMDHLAHDAKAASEKLTPEEKAKIKQLGSDLKQDFKKSLHDMHCMETHTCDDS